jgi:hypothetical protein
MGWDGMGWAGLDWIGLDWAGLGRTGLGWVGISGGEAVRLGRAVTQGVWADVCTARLTWFPLKAPCPLVASPFCPWSGVGEDGGRRRPLAESGSMAGEREGVRARRVDVSGAPGSGTPALRSARQAGGGGLGCCHSLAPATPVQTGASFLGWAAWLRPRHCCGVWEPRRGRGGGRRRGTRAARPALQPALEGRPQDGGCSCQGDIFSRSSQVPASSASPACGLPVYFSPNRLPSGHGASVCARIGREFRLWSPSPSPSGAPCALPPPRSLQLRLARLREPPPRLC